MTQRGPYRSMIPVVAGEGREVVMVREGQDGGAWVLELRVREGVSWVAVAVEGMFGVGV